MAFSTIIDAALITRQQIGQANSAAKPIMQELRLIHRKTSERFFMRSLSSSEFMVFSAIIARTFGWQKIIEIIPLEVLKNGIMDHSQPGEHLMTEDGIPVFSGTGLDKLTIRRAISGLIQKGLIARFAVPTGGREVCAYMPISVLVLVFAVLRFSPDSICDIPKAIKDTLDDQPASGLERCLARQLVCEDTEQFLPAEQHPRRENFTLGQR